MKKERSTRSKRKFKKPSVEERKFRNKIEKEETSNSCLKNSTFTPNQIDDCKKKKRQVTAYCELAL